MQHNSTAGDAIRTLDGSAFDNAVLRAAGPVAVEFMAYSCAHCRQIEAPLQEAALALAQQQGPGPWPEMKEAVYRVNVALEPDLAARYAVQGTPTLVMFMSGEEVARVEGPPPDAAGLLQVMTQPFQA